jgi:hypothetical protein
MDQVREGSPRREYFSPPKIFLDGDLIRLYNRRREGMEVAQGCSLLVRALQETRTRTMPENMYLTDSPDFEHLCELGFTAEEAAKLIYIKEHVEEQAEYRDMKAEQYRLNFLRWLVQHDRISL